MSIKIFCDRCGKECKKTWELRIQTDSSCLRSDFNRVLCRACAEDLMSVVTLGADSSDLKAIGKTMPREKLIAALEMLKVETGSLACLGCGYEHSCAIHGCSIIREGVAYIADLEATHRTEMCEAGYDCTELGKVRKELEAAEARAEKAEKCIAEIEEAMKFQRYYAVALRIFEYRGQKEE